jgi:hypothetical protein
VEDGWGGHGLKTGQSAIEEEEEEEELTSLVLSNLYVKNLLKYNI